jgi:hypothetical protein
MNVLAASLLSLLACLGLRGQQASFTTYGQGCGGSGSRIEQASGFCAIAGGSGGMIAQVIVQK